MITVTTAMQLREDRYNQVEARMRPGQWSTVGFIGQNESLRQVTFDDLETLLTLKITHQQIADRLEGVLKKQQAICSKYGSPAALIEGKYHVSVVVTKGLQPCPFSQVLDENNFSMDELGVCDKDNSYVKIRNEVTKEEVSFPGLMIHLVRNHHFFEGKQIAYRLDPEKVCRVLDIQPDVDYHLKTVVTSKQIWEEIQASNSYEKEQKERIVANAVQTQKVNEYVSAYLLNTQEGFFNFSTKRDNRDYLHVLVDPDYRRIESEKHEIFNAEFELKNYDNFSLCQRKEKIIEEVPLNTNDQPAN